MYLTTTLYEGEYAMLNHSVRGTVRLLSYYTTIILSTAMLYSSSHASALSLRFDSLPSSQGWVFNSDSIIDPVPIESDVSSVDGTSLTLNTIGRRVFAEYTNRGVVNADRPFSFETRARVIEITGDGENDAFRFQVATTPFDFGFSFQSDGQIRLHTEAFTASAFTNIFDVHDYRLDGLPDGSFIFFVDGTSVFSGVASDRITDVGSLLFGDPDGGSTSLDLENAARVEISKMILTQVPEPATIVQLLTGISTLVFLRRRFMKSRRISRYV
jgi:hypothetical protein